jgi:hypothetical protein
MMRPKKSGYSKVKPHHRIFSGSIVCTGSSRIVGFTCDMMCLGLDRANTSTE